ncbi:MAG: glycosyltransferase family 4 protein [Alphaproteobacteria bacterium]|nr:glycosyltransferase family 4 protein [Alphaproteobacteria bacterium SS10]
MSSSPPDTVNQAETTPTDHPGDELQLRGAGRKLLFVITEDWFFYSHFMPMAQAAIDAGYTVAVAARYTDHRNALEKIGITSFELSLDRGRLNPFGAVTLIFRLFSLYRRLKPDVVHHISLKPVVLGSLAARLAAVPVMVNAVTGFGFLFTSTDKRFGYLRWIVGWMLRRTVGAPSSFVLLENEDDAKALTQQGIDAGRITIVGGAGVDPEAFPAMPLAMENAAAEEGQPLKLALVARMLWSKGIDVAVAATKKAWDAGASVELTLVGAPDPLNPAAIPEDQLEEWDDEPGIIWAGRRDDIVAVWGAADIALLPSRGGEGLPRSLIEAAACGRALLTTSVPGCREIVVEGETGHLVPPNDVDALTNVIVALAAEPGRAIEMGKASRQHFETRFTEAHVTGSLLDLYDQATSWAVQAGRLS